MPELKACRKPVNIGGLVGNAVTRDTDFLVLGFRIQQVYDGHESARRNEPSTDYIR